MNIAMLMVKGMSLHAQTAHKQANDSAHNLSAMG